MQQHCHKKKKRKKTPKIMNEQKLIKFCMLTPKSTGHCFSYFLVAMTTTRADNYGCFWQTSCWFFSLANRYIQKRHAFIKERKKKKKTAQKQTEILETVTRHQLIFITALLPRPWKRHIPFLQISLFFSGTLMSALLTDCLQPLLHQKEMKFSLSRSAKTALC